MLHQLFLKPHDAEMTFFVKIAPDQTPATQQNLSWPIANIFSCQFLIFIMQVALPIFGAQVEPVVGPEIGPRISIGIFQFSSPIHRSAWPHRPPWSAGGNKSGFQFTNSLVCLAALVALVCRGRQIWIRVPLHSQQKGGVTWSSTFFNLLDQLMS